MPGVFFERSVAIGGNVMHRELDGEAVVLDLEAGLYFGLDGVGARIWQLIQEHGSLRKVHEILQQEFEASSEALERDLLQFVSRLHAEGLVRVL